MKRWVNPFSCFPLSVAKNPKTDKNTDGRMSKSIKSHYKREIDTQLLRGKNGGSIWEEVESKLKAKRRCVVVGGGGEKKRKKNWNMLLRIELFYIIDVLHENDYGLAIGQLCILLLYRNWNVFIMNITRSRL